jgi:hypothetical protein
MSWIWEIRIMIPCRKTRLHGISSVDFLGQGDFSLARQPELHDNFHWIDGEHEDEVPAENHVITQLLARSLTNSRINERTLPQ